MLKAAEKLCGMELYAYPSERHHLDIIRRYANAMGAKRLTLKPAPPTMIDGAFAPVKTTPTFHCPDCGVPPEMTADHILVGVVYDVDKSEFLWLCPKCKRRVCIGIIRARQPVILS